MSALRSWALCLGALGRSSLCFLGFLSYIYSRFIFVEGKDQRQRKEVRLDQTDSTKKKTNSLFVGQVANQKDKWETKSLWLKLGVGKRT